MRNSGKTQTSQIKIRGLHHNAYRCLDTEETRKFYEEFLELPLMAALEIGETKTGRSCAYLHTFYEMADGSYLAFFEAPEMPFEYTERHDFDLHIALEVERDHLLRMFEKGKAAGIETRGVTDHGFIDSVYFRDPNGYVIELTTRTESHDDVMDPARAREAVDRWQAEKKAGG